MDFGLGYIGIGIGVGLATLGAGFGIGRIGGQAVEGMSRQPEAAGKIQTAMIIAAALIEGAALFGLVIVFLAGSKLNDQLEISVKAKSSISAPAPVAPVAPEAHK
jgi:F-type H+-transporting ATPase subunit c